MTDEYFCRQKECNHERSVEERAIELAESLQSELAKKDERIKEYEWFVAQINEYLVPGVADTKDAALIAFKKKYAEIAELKARLEKEKRECLHLIDERERKLREALEQLASWRKENE